MAKHVLLYTGIIAILCSILVLYFGYKPKVGPIGNGPNRSAIWRNFSLFLFQGIVAITLSVLKFKEEHKE